MVDHSGKARVLIVDDIPENIQLLMENLKGEYALVAAINGQKALQIAASDPVPDLILLDIQMPGLDGYQVIEKLKSDVKTKDIPVIFVTALSEEDNEKKGLDLGAVD
jgi:putative two-component system response regulator